MNNHTNELSRAVRLAHKAQAAPHLRSPQRLARVLYHQWYLGEPVARVPRQRSAPHPWRAWGGDEHLGDGPGLARVQLACAPHTAMHAIAVTTHHAETWGVSWRLVSTAVATPISTVDATVLFVPTAELTELSPRIGALVRDLRPLLGTTTPPLTHRLGPGASLVQNPDDNRNYGKHRCQLIAEASIEAATLPYRQQVSAVATALGSHGIDISRPWVHDSAQWDCAAPCVAA